MAEGRRVNTGDWVKDKSYTYLGRGCVLKEVEGYFFVRFSNYKYLSPNDYHSKSKNDIEFIETSTELERLIYDVKLQS